jgi:L-aspartate semialdehyde sulfurtransferase ferredoxin
MAGQVGRRNDQRRRRRTVIQVRVKLTFPESLVRKPVLANLVRDFEVEPNIRRADVEEHRGWILCELDGQAAQIEAALAWLRQEGIEVDLLGDVLES